MGGTLRSEEDDYEGALADYRHAVTLSALPGGGLLGPVARAMVASLLVHMDRLGEARTELESIDRDAAAGKFFPGLRPLVEHQWGKLERASNRPVDAMRHFAASSRSTEHFISIWAFRGQAWSRRQLGDLTGARSALEEAIRRLEVERISVANASDRASIAETHASVYRDLVSIRWEMEETPARRRRWRSPRPAAPARCSTRWPRRRSAGRLRRRSRRRRSRRRSPPTTCSSSTFLRGSPAGDHRHPGPDCAHRAAARRNRGGPGSAGRVFQRAGPTER